MYKEEDYIRDYYHEQSYQIWLNDYDENNPFQLHERGLISSDDLKNWLEKDRKKAILEKRKKIIEIILKYDSTK